MIAVVREMPQWEEVPEELRERILTPDSRT